jgi:HAD superfamily hydrolase (TIGR01484 family)
MRYLALACDYDGTLAAQGKVGATALRALERLRESGRRLILVTGRQLEDLRIAFPEYEIFDRIVSENGAELFVPETREQRLLSEPPPSAFVEHLRARGVRPLSVGNIIVATHEPHERTVLEAIRDFGLELQVIFNKGAVMVLPSGVNKATGLRAALTDLRISVHNTVAIGDAENDHALLSECDVAVAVANALPMLKQHADWVTDGARSSGVIELIDRMLSTDLRELEPNLVRWQVQLGDRLDAVGTLRVQARSRRFLLCGESGSGKSTLATGLLERLSAKGYQFCLVDPEGDYDERTSGIVVGGEDQAPKTDEVVSLLARGENNVIVNLLGVALDKRPAYLSVLLARLSESRTRYGRPHFIVIDEAHHMLPEGMMVPPDPVERLPLGLLLITVHPEHVARHVLDQVDDLIVVGEAADEAFNGYANALGIATPQLPVATLGSGEALYWTREHPSKTIRFLSTPPRAERHRHRRKYAMGDLGEEKSFFFRGPDNRLKLRAQNLMIFLQLAEGVDDATWLHHLAAHDYSRWIHDAIKDSDLAAKIAEIERSQLLDAMQSREQIRAQIDRVYTLPA